MVSDLTPLIGLDLTMLKLDNTEVSDVTPLCKMQSLLLVSLENTRVTGSQIEHLKSALPNCIVFWSANETVMKRD